MLLIEIEECFLEIFDVLAEHLIIRVEVVDEVLHKQDVVGLERRQRTLPLRLGPPILRGLFTHRDAVAPHCRLRGLSPWLLDVDDAALSDLGLLLRASG
jgi:hypothetical protein